jgi:hypothetical protein
MASFQALELLRVSVNILSEEFVPFLEKEEEPLP